MGCCRGTRLPPATKTYDNSFCTNCRENLMELFKAAAAHQTRGGQGAATLIVKVNCPKCNAVNAYRINVQRVVTKR